MSHHVNKPVNVLSHQDVESYLQSAPEPLRGPRVEAAPREICSALAVFFRRAVFRALEAESGGAELVPRRAAESNDTPYPREILAPEGAALI